MTTVVADCPRCAAQHMTFDVLADVCMYMEHGWQTHHELAVRCRRCDHLSVLKVSLSPDHAQLGAKFAQSGIMEVIEGDLAPVFRQDGFLDVSDLHGVAEPPDHVPDDIRAAFLEGAKCMAIKCQNAAAAMFRLALDLATKPLLPDPAEQIPQPSKQERNVLFHRLEWLMAQRLLAPELGPLAHCLREDGNDGVHQGTLGEHDAQDLLEFTSLLLERQFTVPQRLKNAQARRDSRRGGSGATGGSPLQPPGAP